MSSRSGDAPAAGLRNAVRASAVVGPVVVVHAALQAVLVAPGYPDGATLALIGTAVASLLVLLVGLTLLLSAATVAAGHGRIRWSGVLAHWRSRGAPTAGWAVLLLVAIGMGAALWTVPGLLVAAATPYLLVAAAAGPGNPIAANLRGWRRRPGRTLAAVVVTGVVLALCWLTSALVVFFVRGSAAAALLWLLIGAVGAWLAFGWAVAYRRSQ